MKKNILILFPDQLRADFLSCYGADFINTPNIDRLAKEGILYKRAVSPSPLCVPARASLLTGLNAIKNGVLDNNHWLRKNHVECGVYTWPQKLVEAGYHTEAIGKMHFYPWDEMEGFSHRIIAEDKRHIKIDDDYNEYLKRYDLRKYHGNEHEGYIENRGAIVSKIPEEHQVDRWVSNETCKFINNYNMDKPFALMVGFPGPHCPYDPSDESKDMYFEKNMPESIPTTEESNSFRDECISANKKKWNGVDYTEFNEGHKKKIRAHYCALVKRIDEHVGKIIDVLKEKGIYEDTIIIISADHGDFLGDYSLIGKKYFYESSIRVPLIVRHPKYLNGSDVEKTVSLTDLNKTILKFGNVNYTNVIDSAVLEEFEDKKHNFRDYVFGAINAGFMVTDSKWKYCLYENGQVMLFDMENDPMEQKNLAHVEEYSGVVREYHNIMMKRVMESLNQANFEKTVKAEGVAGGAFCERKWERPYPYLGIEE